MKSRRRPCALALIMAALLIAHPASTAEPAASLSAESVPEKAICRACELRGAGHGEEEVAAFRDFEGARYYFCSDGCADAFDGFPEAYVPPILPRPAPGFALSGPGDEEVRLSDLAGRVVLLDFWATWCAPCVRAMPELSLLHEKWSGRGLSVLGVSIDEKPADKVWKFARKKKVLYPVALDTGDPPAWESYRVVAIPAMFLIDAEGRIIRQWTGTIDLEEVSVAVADAVAARQGEPPPQ